VRDPLHPKLPGDDAKPGVHSPGNRAWSGEIPRVRWGRLLHNLYFLFDSGDLFESGDSAINMEYRA